MKIACDSCGTKYSIDDDKLAGKTFRIRCRKCASMIVLRSPAAATAAAGGGGAAQWHAVQQGRQVGPFESGELLRRRAAGELDDESYVWREGFADWLPLGRVDELRVEAAPPVAVSAELPAAGSGRAEADAGKLVGERNETSALFTLNGLSKLAAPVRGAQVWPSGEAKPGAPAGEGSGLIDIRALAQSYAPAGQPAGAAKAGARAPRVGSTDDLPVFAPAAFVAPGVLIPVPRRRDRRVVVGLAAALSLLAICATLLLVIVFTRDGQPAPEAAERPPAASSRVAAVERPAPRTPSPAVVEAPPAPAVTETAPPPAPPAVTAPPSARTTTTPPARTTTPPARTTPPPARTTSTPPPARTTTPPPARTTTTTSTAPPAAAAKCDQVTCIVNGYDSDCCRALQRGSAPAVPPPGTTPKTAVPENLDRDAIKAGLATISMKRCTSAAPAGSLVKAQVKVSADGAVTTVNVQSSPDAALSACVVEQAQKGRFRTTQRGASFGYVWRF